MRHLFYLLPLLLTTCTAPAPPPPTEAEAPALAPTTEPAAAAVPKKTLPAGKLAILPLSFDLGSFEVTESARRIIDDRALGLLRKYPEARIRVEGHSDAREAAGRVGPPAIPEIALKRAQATVDYLVSKGIKPDRLTAVGRDNDEPIHEGRLLSERQHQEHRRVVFYAEGPE